MDSLVPDARRSKLRGVGLIQATVVQAWQHAVFVAVFVAVGRACSAVAPTALRNFETYNLQSVACKLKNPPPLGIEAGAGVGRFSRAATASAGPHAEEREAFLKTSNVFSQKDYNFSYKIRTHAGESESAGIGLHGGVGCTGLAPLVPGICKLTGQCPLRNVPNNQR